MKKLYTTLAMASMMAGTIAAAAPTVSNAQKSYDAPSKMMSLSTENVEFGQQKLNKGTETRAIANIEDICGVYKINEDWWWPFSGDPGDAPSFFISALSGNMIEISCNQMGMCEPILATVDLSAGTITIKADDNKNLAADPAIDLHLRYIDFADGNKLKDTSSVVGTVVSTGQIDFLDSVFLWGNSDGYYYGVGNFYLTPMEMFSYNANEWVEAGKAKFTDSFVNPLLTGNNAAAVPETEVAFYYNKEQRSKCLLKNPYGAEVWQQALGGTEEGYIVFDISNPDCVTMTPLVGSGVIINFGTQDAPDPDELFFFNNEGYNLMNGRSTASQVEEAEEAMDPFTQTLADYLSSFDASTGTVKIRNGFFGLSTDPVAKYYWNGVSKPAYLTCTIVLPEEYVSGVNDVVAEDADAPVKYYNLQGMEVKAPEAGQLVIKKQGTKTSKYIAK